MVVAGHPKDLKKTSQNDHLLSDASIRDTEHPIELEKFPQTHCLLSDTNFRWTGRPILPKASRLFSYFLSIGSINGTLFGLI